MKLNRRNNEGFTLVELLIVVAIIGIIAAIAIPNLLSAIQRGRQKRSMGDIKTTASTIEQYNTDANTYPGAGTGVAPLAAAAPYGPLYGVAPTQLDASYLAAPIWKDGWSTTVLPTPFSYGADGGGLVPASNYTFCSRGRNNTSDAGSTYPCAQLALTNIALPAPPAGVDATLFDCDITIVDGQFMSSPVGKQAQGVC